MSSTAVITGINGQDGYYLAQQLLDRGYRVVGVSRRRSSSSPVFVDQWDIRNGAMELIRIDYDRAMAWDDLLHGLQPTEFYHLAGMTTVRDSWEDPQGAIAANLDSTAYILESIRRYSPTTRLFYASSSEVFGQPLTGPQNEQSTLTPTSPYGVTKAASQLLVDVYRVRYGLFACSGILFNHESPRRPVSFVTRKITAAAAAISTGLQSELALGNLDSVRDFGAAIDFVDCMSRMLQADEPQNYVIGTGVHTSIRQLLDAAFGYVGLDWNQYVRVDPQIVRVADATPPRADASKARHILGWTPQYTVLQLIEQMVQHDCDLLRSATIRRAA